MIKCGIRLDVVRNVLETLARSPTATSSRGVFRGIERSNMIPDNV
jgi:hypothetical protein